MSDELKDKVEGTFKEKAGEVTGDRQMETEGALQGAKGEVEEHARKAGGAVEEAVGKVTGDPAREAEGAADRA